MKKILSLNIETLEPRIAPSGIGGIDPTGGHLGISASARTASTLRSVGGAAFDVGATGGQIAAGAFGGPGAAAAVGSLREFAIPGGGFGTGSTFGAPGAGFGDQVALFQLQQAVNRDSEQFQALTNLMKAKHDAVSSAVNNLR